jgi:pimeloyl-ACP methyl ester carboxylesterase
VSPNPVLLLHGFATSAATTWGDNGWIDLLGDAGRAVIAPDLLGHGRSAKPHDPAAYRGVEADIITVLDEVPAGQPVDAIGFSYGARVLLTLASADPDRFANIVVAGVGANLVANTDDSGVLAAAIESDVPDQQWAMYFHRLAHGPGNDPVALAAFLRRPDRPPITDEGLANITGPVLVVLGDRDFAGPAEPLLERLPQARLVTLANTDHFATPKHFGFLEAALDFVGAGT